MLSQFEKENSYILYDLIYNVVKKYKTVNIIDDCSENKEVIFSFFKSMGLSDINYILDSDESKMCNLYHGSLMNGSSCNIQRIITIKSSNLCFYPCFKATEIKNLEFGAIDKNTLEIIPKNVELATILYLYNPIYSNPKCDRCNYSLLCHKGCYIDNYIINKDFFQPIEDNCKIYIDEINSMMNENKDIYRYIIHREERIECIE